MSGKRTPRLFYDGSCALCRREMADLQTRLSRHFLLVDISDPGFQGWQGADRQTMMQKIHVWTGAEFLVGLDASLYYWEKAGWKWLARLLRLPVIHAAATMGYNLWAQWRVRKQRTCKVCTG